jgi:hypothetical protein
MMKCAILITARITSAMELVKGPLVLILLNAMLDFTASRMCAETRYHQEAWAANQIMTV